jgi:hypothetical protein
MAELNPAREPDGRVGRNTDPPRRFISTSKDGLSGFWTAKSDEQLASENAALAVHQAEIIATNLRHTPQAVAAAQAERAASELQRWNARWPDPRQALRDAHGTLHQAETALGQCRAHLVLATAHIGQCEAGVERTRLAVEEVRRRQSAALREQLTGTAPGAKLDERDETEAMDNAERARRGLIVAQAAEADIAASVRGAEQTVAEAKRRVEECARAVCHQALREKREELGRLERQAETVRDQTFQLQAALDYQPQRWTAHLQKLLIDPEALLSPE